MNKNFKKPANDAGNNENISTKKGFLLSLTGKKNQGEIKSTINFSSPQKITESNTPDNKNDKNNRDKNNKGGFKKSNKPQKSKDTLQNTAEQKPSVKDDKQSREYKPNNHRNNRPNQLQKANNNNKQQKGQNQKNNNAQNIQNNNQNQQKQKNNNQDNRNNRKNKNSNQNNQNNQNNQKKNRDRSNNASSNRHERPRTPLSALSSDMQSFSAVKDYEKQNASLIKEPSLEEKYKDAMPLADRIALEDKKARHPVFTMSEDTLKQEIVGIRFREGGKIYYFDPDGNQIPYGTSVIVETARGSEYGFTALSNRFIPQTSLVSPLKKIVRIATAIDTQKYTANKMLEKQAAEVFKEKVSQLNLAMNLIYVEYTFDNSKLLFYFTAETRIDFRELVKELAGVFRTRIELRQIGVRDEAKVLGCLGVCGRSACCASFLGDFAQVSIKMAKDQNLSLNAAKISGACGKLMCCLRYEDKVYEEENARTPKIGAIVETPEGKGTVTERNALRATVSVSLENSPDAPPKVFNRDEVSVVGFNASHEDAHGRIDENADELKDDE